MRLLERDLPIIYGGSRCAMASFVELYNRGRDTSVEMVVLQSARQECVVTRGEMRLCSECQMDNLLLVLTPSRVEKKSETTDGIAPAALRVETGMPPGTLHRTIHPGRPKFDGRHCIGERRLRSGMWNHSPSFVLLSSSLHFTTHSLSILPSRRSFVAFCEKDGLPADSEIRVTGSGVWLVLTTGAAPDASSNLQQSGQPSHLSFFILLLFGCFYSVLL